MKINKILVTVAGRGLCEEMLNMLMDIPSIQQASVTVLHVVPSQASAEAMSEKLEAGGKILAQAVQSIKVDPSKVNPRLKQGDPKDIVCQVADEENSDLIIIGSRGLQGLRAILENSVSQYVFQLTSRPMLLVKDGIYVKKLKHIMVALDASDSSKEYLDLALSLVKDIHGGQLILAHVNKDITGKSSEDFSNKAEADPVIAAALEPVKRMGVSYRCVSAIGKPGPEICRIASDVGADLLILGSPDRRPTVAKSLVDLDRLLGGSQSDYVRVHAECPVLLARTAAP
ncbi:MAG: universal stress protein [Limnoraphis sp. WC205]|nr:universal stress protein [Limnoraphis sp. WC205]